MVVQGGFWGEVTVQQTVDAPELRIRFLGNGWALLSWPRTVHGFVLQETSFPGTGLWTTTSEAVVDSPLEHTVLVPTLGTFKCYRLRTVEVQ